MDDLVHAIALAVEKRKELPSELTVLIGEEQTLSYDELQREISRLLCGKEIKTFSIPKLIAEFGAWVQCHIPFKDMPFIKPWMIPLADDHYELDTSLAAKELGWKPKHHLKKTIPIMIEALKADPVKWYKDNQLKMSNGMAKKPRKTA
jgi:nucleoside-diphosphate-sugar epimerase